MEHIRKATHQLKGVSFFDRLRETALAIYDCIHQYSGRDTSLFRRNRCFCRWTRTSLQTVPLSRNSSADCVSWHKKHASSKIWTWCLLEWLFSRYTFADWSVCVVTETNDQTNNQHKFVRNLDFYWISFIWKEI